MTKIFREDVFQLADRLLSEGKFPSGTAILALHRASGGAGGGVGTIVRHLQAWRVQRAKHESEKKEAIDKAIPVSKAPSNDAAWPDIPASLDASFIDAEDFVSRIEAVSKEIGAIPSSATLFRRLRYAGHWLTSVQRKQLSIRLHLPLERQVAGKNLWSREDLINAVIVACRNDVMRLPSGKKLVQLFGNSFRLAAHSQFNGHIPIAREAKKIEPYIVIRPGVYAVDGTELQSEQEKLVYDGLSSLLAAPTGRLSTNVTIADKAASYLPDIVIDDWLIVEVMMFDWATPIPTADENKKRLITTYLERNRNKCAAYERLERHAVFLEPGTIGDPERLADILKQIVGVAGQGRDADLAPLKLEKNVHSRRQFQSLQEIRLLLEPLYEETGIFPTTGAMRKAGLVGIEVAIRKIHGGRDKVAAVFGWPTNNRQHMPRGYFNDFDNVRKAVMALVPEGTSDMPTQLLLAEKYPPGLVAAIHREHGGMGGVARALGLATSAGTLVAANAVRYGTWNDYEEVKKAVLSLVQRDSNRMPYKAEFEKAGIAAAYTAIVMKHGGLEKVAGELGLVLDKKASAIREAITQWHESHRRS